ncbi:phosphoribosylformylglycinamidine synthase subunit PurL [Candidatus Marinimicrobia bacterium MT.SAG.2]|nr:phosphoribosylformylglycinamidine synthase subunit PurL [Candidatus Marinimicrobia bacterium MT.SAG.2]
MKEQKVTLELAIEHGLTEGEYEEINGILGRDPNYTELGIFSVMWSEHCSYKSSIAELKKLPKEGKHILSGAGEENAGLVDIGDGIAVAFKIESHNHPSAIEPYQGAATGVGGIMRDIFTMGARPIASLNSLRFGPLDSAKNRYLLDGVVRGIGDYGNCMGVPTVAGEICFDPHYEGNPLVNAMAVGIVRHKNTASAIAKGEGNSVMLLGSSTGRDGIHGATFASVELSEKSEEKRPAVQVGDPFTEKLLLEAVLELTNLNLLVGMQDMGAAGIICSSAEMADKGGVGMEIDLSKVPLREKGMIPYEILLSESQERMLLVVRKGKDREVMKIAGKWRLNCVKIGKVVIGSELKFRMKGNESATVPAESLVLGGGAPVYHRESRQPDYLEKLREFDVSDIEVPEDLESTFLKLLASSNIASKRWIYRQYDSTVQSNTIHGPGQADAAVIRIKEAPNKAIALKTDGNGRYTYINPRKGGMIAVAEAARNVVCTGAKPLAITNCLNFGNPEDPEVFWTFKEAVAGIGEACKVLETPVTGGNVSFYNENPEGAVFPTPVIGMLGLIEDLAHVRQSGFVDEGDFIILLGNLGGCIGGSEYLNLIHGRVEGDVPNIDLEYEKMVQDSVLEGIRQGVIKSAHDISDGGLAIALAECCMAGGNNLGANIVISRKIRDDELLFGETQSAIIVTISESDLMRIEEVSGKFQIPCETIGKVSGNSLSINSFFDIAVSKLRKIYESALPELLERRIR